MSMDWASWISAFLKGEVELQFRFVRVRRPYYDAYAKRMCKLLFVLTTLALFLEICVVITFKYEQSIIANSAKSTEQFLIMLDQYECHKNVSECKEVNSTGSAESKCLLNTTKTNAWKGITLFDDAISFSKVLPYDTLLIIAKIAQVQYILEDIYKKEDTYLVFLKKEKVTLEVVVYENATVFVIVSEYWNITSDVNEKGSDLRILESPVIGRTVHELEKNDTFTAHVLILPSKEESPGNGRGQNGSQSDKYNEAKINDLKIE